METSNINQFKFKISSPTDSTKDKIVSVAGKTYIDALNLARQIYQDCDVELIDNNSNAVN